MNTSVHGGERRVSACRLLIQSLGWQLICGGIYRRDAIPPLGENKVQLTKKQEKWLSETPEEWQMRLSYAVLSDRLQIRSWKKMLESVSPDVIWLEQPFLWPIVKRTAQKLPIIYDSHNIEWLIKDQLLRCENSEEIINFYRLIEIDLVKHASLVVCCTEGDASIYKKFNKNVLVMPNGTSKPRMDMGVSSQFDGLKNKYVVTYISSAHKPNWVGIEEVVLPILQHVDRNSGLVFVLAGSIAKLYKKWGKLNGEINCVIPIESVSEAEKWELIHLTDLMLLPIFYGGGSNLKAAEALISNKEILASNTSFRGYEKFSALPGVRVVPDESFSEEFIAKIRNIDHIDKRNKVLYNRPSVIELTWQHIINISEKRMQQYIK